MEKLVFFSDVIIFINLLFVNHLQRTEVKEISILWVAKSNVNKNYYGRP
jgi:hypothetical protein